MPVSINPNLLIAAPMLQDYLVDKDGTPMANGTITCFHDNSRTTLKNWYYQSGTPGNYTYIPLPNPLQLSSAGTICDLNGVDTIPFFYPYSELDENTADPYYITIVNFKQTNQITRANFPFVPSSGSSGSIINTFNNLIANNGFWRNRAPNAVNITPFTSISLNNSVLSQDSLTGLYSGIMAPSQHDGFRMPDIQYVTNNLTATDTLTFIPFPLGISQPISGAIVPEYYINHDCTAAGTGVSTKCYQFPISLHVNNLANIPFTFSFQAQNAGGTGTGENLVTIFIFQDTGSGTTAPIPIEIGQFSLSTSWTTYTIQKVFPATAGLVLGKGQDDALYLQIQMPLGKTSTINFTKPSIYLTQGLVPNYDFTTYDQTDTIINSPRTGDIRTSINSFYNFGWIPMNDGTIGNGLSNATNRANADTWQLYNLLWSLAKNYDSGSTFNGICQLYNSAGTPINYSSNSISDFNANNSLAVTRMMGRVMMGTVPIDAVINGGWQQSVTASNATGFILFTGTNGSILFQGQPVTFTAIGGSFPTNIASTFVYFVSNIVGNSFTISTTYNNALVGAGIIPWGGTAGSNVIAHFDNSGAYLGEYSHLQLLSEMIAHTHDLSGFTGNNDRTGGAPGTGVTGTIAGTTQTLGVHGYISQTPFNVTQPGAFYNMYMKL